MASFPLIQLPAGRMRDLLLAEVSGRERSKRGQILRCPMPQAVACAKAEAGRAQKHRQLGQTEPPTCACLLLLLLNHFMYITTEVSLVT